MRGVLPALLLASLWLLTTAPRPAHACSCESQFHVIAPTPGGTLFSDEGVIIGSSAPFETDLRNEDGLSVPLSRTSLGTQAQACGPQIHMLRPWEGWDAGHYTLAIWDTPAEEERLLEFEVVDASAEDDAGVAADVPEIDVEWTPQIVRRGSSSCGGVQGDYRLRIDVTTEVPSFLITTTDIARQCSSRQPLTRVDALGSELPTIERSLTLTFPFDARGCVQIGVLNSAGRYLVGLEACPPDGAIKSTDCDDLFALVAPDASAEPSFGDLDAGSPDASVTPARRLAGSSGCAVTTRSERAGGLLFLLLPGLMLRRRHRAPAGGARSPRHR